MDSTGYYGFADYAKKLFNEPALADIDILLDNDLPQEGVAGGSTKTFHGHRVVLATMSDYFRSMLYGPFVEAGSREIRLKDVPFSTFELCMRFLYCGWDDRLAELTLDEAELFYGMARMLLIDSKVKDLFWDWLKGKLESWESEIWRIIKFAIEMDLAPLIESGFEYFGYIASCGLKMDGFVEASLATVQKIIAKRIMSCSKVELHEAITRWVKANKDRLSEKDEQKLFDDVAKLPAVCYRGQQICIAKQNNSPKAKKLKVASNNSTKKPSEESQESPRECSYSYEMSTQQCLTLFGVTVMFKSNGSGVDSALDVEFSITKRYADKPVLCSRKVRIDCGSTQLYRNIFFKPIEICRASHVTVAIKWTNSGLGAQPTMCLFEPVQQDYVYFIRSFRDASPFTHIFCRNENPSCSNCVEDSDDSNHSDNCRFS